MNSLSTFLIDFTPGPPLSIRLETQDSPVTVQEALPLLFTIADSLIRRTLSVAEQAGASLGCAKGCSACCSLLVPVSNHEALNLERLVRNFPEQKRHTVTNRFDAIVSRLEATGLLPRLVAGYRKQVQDTELLRELAVDYWSLSMPCPFLEENACSIYENRPMVCRQYLMASEPALCRTPFRPGTELRMVRHPYDPGGALAAFDGTGITRTNALPLSLSLFLAPRLRKPFPKLPPTELVNRYLNCLAMGFSGAQ